MAVSALLRTQLEPASGLFTRRLQDDVRCEPIAVSAPGAPVLAAGRCPVRRDAMLRRDHVDVCGRLGARQCVPGLSRVQVLHECRQQFGAKTVSVQPYSSAGVAGLDVTEQEALWC